MHVLVVCLQVREHALILCATCAVPGHVKRTSSVPLEQYTADDEQAGWLPAGVLDLVQLGPVWDGRGKHLVVL